MIHSLIGVYFQVDVKWQLAEPGALMSAKAYRDKKALPLAEKLKEVVKNVTIKYVQLMEKKVMVRLCAKIVAETKDREVVGTIRNMGCGGCYALYFCGKWKLEVI